MVEINNQRKAFLDMLAWSEGTDNGRQKTRNHGYDVIVGGELFTDYSDHPRKLVTLNPKEHHCHEGLGAAICGHRRVDSPEYGHTLYYRGQWAGRPYLSGYVYGK